MTAARTGKADAVKALLVHGATANARESFEGETALMWAAAENHVDVTKLLLEVGADIDARSKALDTPKLSFPRSGGPNTPFPRGGWTAAMYAARQGAAETTRVLAERGANLNVQDPDGTTALMLAIINAHYDTAAVLIEKGADPNVVDVSGMPALYAAVDIHTVRWTFGRPAPFLTEKLTAVDIVRMLLEHGAQPNAMLRRALLARHHDPGDRQLSTGSTALMRAVKTGRRGRRQAAARPWRRWHDHPTQWDDGADDCRRPGYRSRRHGGRSRSAASVEGHRGRRAQGARALRDAVRRRQRVQRRRRYGAARCGQPQRARRQVHPRTWRQGRHEEQARAGAARPRARQRRPRTGRSPSGGRRQGATGQR